MDETSGGLIERAPRPDVFSLETEYAARINSLQETGILAQLSDERVGVRGIDNKEYPLPALEELKELFDKNKDLVAEKTKQGFTRLLLTPLAMPVRDFERHIDTTLRKHESEGKLFLDPFTYQGPDERPGRVHPWAAVIIASDIESPDLIYFPKGFEEGKTNGGITKEQAVQDTNVCAFPGWSVGLIEDISEVAQEGEAKTIEGRKQLERGEHPEVVLERLQTQPYRGETGLTPEDFLTEFITHLEETNHVIQDSGQLFLIGAFIPDEGSIPRASWSEKDDNLHITNGYPRKAFTYGSQTAVRLPA